MKELRGTGIALVTPFTLAGDVDYAALSRLIDHYMKMELTIWCVGNNRRNRNTFKHEQREISRSVVAINAGRIPLVIGLGSNNTKALVEEIHEFDFTGFSAILSVCPYYNKPNQEGIYQHFKAVAGAAPLPLLLYNVPEERGAELTMRLQFDWRNHVQK